jgi:hypothetical protein
MSKKEKPLPIPPNSPIGRKKGFMQNEEEEPLMADQIAKAMAEGKLEEFLQREIPDNEYAKALTMMMLKMTGMSPSEVLPSVPMKEPEKPSTIQPSEDVINAVKSGNVKELLKLLEKDTIDQLIKISSDNKVTLEWIVLRALRVYVQEYLKTGRL